jgi:radical SAM superfamily enzyme YgiQ (UPF0313 family)
MKVLLVYPQAPETFWSFSRALRFISKKSSVPPLGLITVAAMLSDAWELKLLDMNVEPIKDKDIRWADYVFISAMVIQKKSARWLIDRCKALQVKTVAGGPLFTCEPSEFDDVDHLLLNEGELTVPGFLRDLENGCSKHIYEANEWADITKTPAPLWRLVDIKKYASLNIQYSRGCPYNCEFCNITSLFGHEPRTKSAEQILRELDMIYETGWRGAVFFVDDNFIGNKIRLKKEVLPALIQWMQEREHPFSFNTEVSINLADDEELMDLMTRAGFNCAFVGIETVNEASLAECNKIQNRNRDLSECIRKIQRAGIEVQGGFIVGFDSDDETIFNRMISFIQDTGIVTAMVGLLNAPKGTLLYKRLKGEGRITENCSGDNTDFSINFLPRMDVNTLIHGYERIVRTIYSPKYFYERVTKYLKEFYPLEKGKAHISIHEIGAFFKAILKLGIVGEERKYYWKLVFWSLLKQPKAFSKAITYAIYGYHFRKVFETYTTNDND